MRRQVRVGMVGYRFMGKAHSHAFRDLTLFFPDVPAEPVMQVLCGRDPEGVRQAASQYGWAHWETDWRRLVARDDVDLVDVGAPSDVHKEIVLAAAAAGKDILCEKPLALTARDAAEMMEAVERAGVVAMVGFNYRFVPAIQLARRLIQEGRLGQIYHVRFRYLQDWITDPNFPLVWRLRKEVAGAGALGDIASHSVDLARFLVGEIEQVVGTQETFIRQRPVLARATGAGLTAEAGAEMGDVTVDDAALFLARFAGGALGSFEATRLAAGHKNGHTFEINGSLGSIRFNMERMTELEFYDRTEPEGMQGFRTIVVGHGSHPYGQAWWPPGHNIGYGESFVHEVYELMKGVAARQSPPPTFLDGLRCQLVLEAVEESVRSERWVRVPQV